MSITSSYFGRYSRDLRDTLKKTTQTTVVYTIPNYTMNADERMRLDMALQQVGWTIDSVQLDGNTVIHARRV